MLLVPKVKVVLKKLYKQLGIAIKDFTKGITVENKDGFGIALNYSDGYKMESPASTKILVGDKNLSTAGVLVWKLK